MLNISLYSLIGWLLCNSSNSTDDVFEFSCFQNREFVDIYRLLAILTVGRGKQLRQFQIHLLLHRLTKLHELAELGLLADKLTSD